MDGREILNDISAKSTIEVLQHEWRDVNESGRGDEYLSVMEDVLLLAYDIFL